MWPTLKLLMFDGRFRRLPRHDTQQRRVGQTRLGCRPSVGAGRCPEISGAGTSARLSTNDRKSRSSRLRQARLNARAPWRFIACSRPVRVIRACIVGIANAYVKPEGDQSAAQPHRRSNDNNKHCARNAHRRRQTGAHDALAAMQSGSLARQATKQRMQTV